MAVPSAPPNLPQYGLPGRSPLFYKPYAVNGQREASHPGVLDGASLVSVCASVCLRPAAGPCGPGSCARPERYYVLPSDGVTVARLRSLDMLATLVSQMTSA